MDAVRKHEEELAGYALERLAALRFLTIFGPRDPARRSGVVSFTDADIHPHDLSQFLDQVGVAIRAGHHCAQPLLRKLGQVATARASFYIYTGKDDIDALAGALIEARKYFGFSVS
jgi:cysteine desulfurase/selenocysteine lyase